MEPEFTHDGSITRETELESALQELIDLWDKGNIICDVVMDKEDVDYIDSIFGHAAAILNDEQN